MTESLQFKHSNLSEDVARILNGIQAVTKTLKLQSIKQGLGRKLVISTNWLNIFDFFEGNNVEEEVVGLWQGMTVTKTKETDQTKRVYGRDYASRTRETLMDVRHQQKLSNAFGCATHAHITFTHRKLIIVPVFNHIDKMEDVGLKINIHKDGDLYVGILDAVDVIKARAFKVVTIASDVDFDASHEKLLLSMQLRRLGYQLDTNIDGQLVAKLAQGEPLSTEHINTVSCVTKKLVASLNTDTPLSTFAVCSGGVDVHAMEQDDFSVKSILEFRPTESRDIKKGPDGSVISVNDKTELCAISAAINSAAPTFIFNEDIYQFKLSRIASSLPKHNLLHISSML